MKEALFYLLYEVSFLSAAASRFPHCRCEQIDLILNIHVFQNIGWPRQSSKQIFFAFPETAKNTKNLSYLNGRPTKCTLKTHLKKYDAFGDWCFNSLERYVHFSISE